MNSDKGENDFAWDGAFAGSRNKLADTAAMAIAEHKAGKTKAMGVSFDGEHNDQSLPN